MSVEFFEIPVSLLHRDDNAKDLLAALIPYDAHQWEEALEPLEAVARTGNILALFKYANTLGNLDIDDAAEHFWRIAIDAGHTDSCNNLANLLKNQGRNEEVLPLYQKAADAGAPDAIFNIGLLLQDEDPEAGEEWFLKAVEAGHAKACSNLALKYFTEERLEEAYKYAELGIERGCLYAAGAIGLYHQRREEFDLAVEALNRAIPLFSISNYNDQVHIYNLLAFCQIMLGRYAEAEETIEHCREHESIQTEDFVNLITKLRDADSNEAHVTPKFCPGCGTPTVAGNSFCTNCGKGLTTAPSATLNTLSEPTMVTSPTLTKSSSVNLGTNSKEIRVTQKVAGTTFGAFEAYVSDCEEVITPDLNGAMSIDGGMLAISGEPLPACETCYGYSEKSAQFNCADCGRTTENYLHVRSGFGDGIYVNYDLYWDSICAGTMTIFDQGNEFASTIYNSLTQIRNKTVEYNQATLDFWDVFHATDKNLEIHYFGSVQTKFDPRWSNEANPYGSLYFGDTGEGIDSLSSVIYGKNMPVDKHLVYGFCEVNDKGVLIPRLVLTLRQSLAEKLALPTSNPNMSQVHETWQNAGVFASIGGQLSQQAVQINIAAEYAALENPDYDNEDINDHQTQLFSWLVIQYYQGNLPPGMMEHLKGLTLNMIQVYLRLRTCFGLADQLTSWPPASSNKLV
jgi:tetratricopeptide (TPR) repeat protein